jgi:hypothetical protein
MMCNESLSDGRLRPRHVGTPNVAFAIDEMTLIRMGVSQAHLCNARIDATCELCAL